MHLQSCSPVPDTCDHSPIHNFKAMLHLLFLPSWIYQEDLQSIHSSNRSENPFPQMWEPLLAVTILACSSTGMRSHGETRLGLFRVVSVLPDSLSIRVRLKNHIRLPCFCSPPSSAHILPTKAYTWILIFFPEVYSSTS